MKVLFLAALVLGVVGAAPVHEISAMDAPAQKAPPKAKDGQKIAALQRGDQALWAAVKKEVPGLKAPPKVIFTGRFVFMRQAVSLSCSTGLFQEEAGEGQQS